MLIVEATGRRVEQPSAEELAVLKDPSAPIQKPAAQPKVSTSGRVYTPKLSQGTIPQVTGLSQTQWKQVKQMVRSLYTAHKLNAFKDGEMVPWEQINWRNKEAAFTALENSFKVLKRCEGHWASIAVFEAHFEYHREKVRPTTAFTNN